MAGEDKLQYLINISAKTDASWSTIRGQVQASLKDVGRVPITLEFKPASIAQLQKQINAQLSKMKVDKSGARVYTYPIKVHFDVNTRDTQALRRSIQSALGGVADTSTAQISNLILKVNELTLAYQKLAQAKKAVGTLPGTGRATPPPAGAAPAGTKTPRTPRTPTGGSSAGAKETPKDKQQRAAEAVVAAEAKKATDARVVAAKVATAASLAEIAEAKRAARESAEKAKRAAEKAATERPLTKRVMTAAERASREAETKAKTAPRQTMSAKEVIAQTEAAHQLKLADEERLRRISRGSHASIRPEGGGGWRGTSYGYPSSWRGPNPRTEGGFRILRERDSYLNGLGISGIGGSGLQVPGSFYTRRMGRDEWYGLRQRNRASRYNESLSSSIPTFGRGAIEQYTSNGYPAGGSAFLLGGASGGFINKMLRTTGGRLDDSGEIAKQLNRTIPGEFATRLSLVVDVLDRTLATMKGTRTRAWRGANLDEFGVTNKNQIRPGQIVTNLGYTSSSSSRDIARQFGGLNSALVRLNIPRGIGKYVAPFSSGVSKKGEYSLEQEVLLPRGSSYQVRRVGKKFIEADVLPYSPIKVGKGAGSTRASFANPDAWPAVGTPTKDSARRERLIANVSEYYRRQQAAARTPGGGLSNFLDTLQTGESSLSVAHNADFITTPLGKNRKGQNRYDVQAGTIPSIAGVRGDILTLLSSFHELTHPAVGAGTHTSDRFRNASLSSMANKKRAGGVIVGRELLGDFLATGQTAGYLRSTGMSPRKAMSAATGALNDPVYGYWGQQFGAGASGKRAFTHDYRLLKKQGVDIAKLNMTDVGQMNQLFQAMSMLGPKLKMFGTPITKKLVSDFKRTYRNPLETPFIMPRVGQTEGKPLGAQAIQDMYEAGKFEGALGTYGGSRAALRPKAGQEELATAKKQTSEYEKQAKAQAKKREAIEAQARLAKEGKLDTVPLQNMGWVGRLMSGMGLGNLPPYGAQAGGKPVLGGALQASKWEPRRGGGSPLGNLGFKFENVMSYGLAGGALYQVIGMLQQSAQAIITTETAMSKLNRVINVGSGELGTYRTALVGLATEYGVTIDKVAAAAEEWAKQGARGETLSNLTEQSVMLANIGDMEPAAAVKALNGAMKQWNVSLSDGIVLIDKWAKMSQTQRVSVSDLAHGFSQVGTLARNSGLDIDQFNALLGTTSSVSNETGENIANAFRSIFSRLGKPNKQITDAFRSIGIDAKSYIGNVPGILDQIASKWDTMTSSQKNIIAQAAAEKRRAAIFFNMMQAYKDVNLYQKAYNDSQKASGTAAQMNENRMKSLEKTIASLGQAFGGFANQLFETGLGQAFGALVKGLTGALSWYNKLPVAIRAVTNNVLLLVGAYKAAQMALKTMNIYLAMNTALLGGNSVASAGGSRASLRVGVAAEAVGRTYARNAAGQFVSNAASTAVGSALPTASTLSSVGPAISSFLLSPAGIAIVIALIAAAGIAFAVGAGDDEFAKSQASKKSTTEQLDKYDKLVAKKDKGNISQTEYVELAKMSRTLIEKYPSQGTVDNGFVGVNSAAIRKNLNYNPDADKWWDGFIPGRMASGYKDVYGNQVNTMFQPATQEQRAIKKQRELLNSKSEVDKGLAAYPGIVSTLDKLRNKMGNAEFSNFLQSRVVGPGKVTFTQDASKDRLIGAENFYNTAVGGKEKAALIKQLRSQIYEDRGGALPLSVLQELEKQRSAKSIMENPNVLSDLVRQASAQVAEYQRVSKMQVLAESFQKPVDEAIQALEQLSTTWEELDKTFERLNSADYAALGYDKRLMGAAGSAMQFKSSQASQNLDIGSALSAGTALGGKSALLMAQVEELRVRGTGQDIEQAQSKMRTEGAAIQNEIAKVISGLLQGAQAATDAATQAANLRTAAGLVSSPYAADVAMYDRFGMNAGQSVARGHLTGNRTELKNRLGDAEGFLTQYRNAKTSDESTAAYYGLVGTFNSAGSLIEEVIAAEKEMQAKVQENIQREKDLWNLWFNGLKAYVSFLDATEQASTSQTYLLTAKIRKLAKTPQDKLDLDQQLFDLRKKVIDERLSGAEGWLNHQVALDRVSLPTQIKVWERVLTLAKSAKNQEWIWKAEEKIYQLKEEQANNISKALASVIFKRAAGLTGPLAIGIAEYRAALGEGAAKSEKDISDTGDILSQFTSYMEEAFGGMTTNISGNVDSLWARTKAYANSLRAADKAAQAAADRQNGLSQATLGAIQNLGNLQTLIGNLTTPAGNAAAQLDRVSKSLSSLGALVFGTPAPPGNKNSAAYLRWEETYGTNSYGESWSKSKKVASGVSKDLTKDLTTANNLWNSKSEYGSVITQAFVAAMAIAGMGKYSGANATPTGGGGSSKMGFPVPGGVFSNTWGAGRSGGRKHMGTDIFAKKGTPVYSLFDGTATVKTGGLGGKVVYVAGAAGRAYYAHLNSQTVKNGQRVSYGTLIGTVGNTGNAKNTPPHVHFQYAPKGGQGWVNPYQWLRQWAGLGAKSKTAHAGMLGGTDETFYTMVQKGEAVIPKQEVPILFNILNKLNDSSLWNNSGSNTINLELNLQMPDGRTVSINETVTGISGTKVKIERKII